MSKKTPYKAETFAPALFIMLLASIVIALVALLVWGLVALFMAHPVAAFILVLCVLVFVGGIFLVQYLDDKYEWGLLENW